MFLKVVAPLFVLFMAVASAGVPGAPTDVDLNRDDVQNALQFAVAQHNKASNDAFVNQVSRVIGVQTQVVAGLKYIFNVEMARTGCKKTEAGEACDVSSDPDIAQPRECKLAVWSQPWRNSIKLVENTC